MNFAGNQKRLYIDHKVNLKMQCAKGLLFCLQDSYCTQTSHQDMSLPSKVLLSRMTGLVDGKRHVQESFWHVNVRLGAVCVLTSRDFFFFWGGGGQVCILIGLCSAGFSQPIQRMHLNLV